MKRFIKEKFTFTAMITYAMVIIIAILFRSLLFDNFHIPTGSMKNTLLVGDKITVSMFSYGYSRYSFPFGIAPIKGRIFAKTPERGDIVVFKYPTQTSISYVKRLIGLPGDVIQMINGELYINKQKVERKFIDFVEDFDFNQKFTLSRYEETLPNGKKYFILKYFDGNGYADNTKEFIVPQGHYFFMGDNRDFSKDSRFEDVSFVKEELLLGRVERILISSPSSLLNVFDWHNIRFTRIFKKPE